MLRFMGANVPPGGLIGASGNPRRSKLYAPGRRGASNPPHPGRDAVPLISANYLYRPSRLRPILLVMKPRADEETT